MRSREPTKKQLAFLESVGIVPPPSKLSSGGIIGYILRGNGTIGSSLSDRIAITKKLQQEWLGKTVAINVGRFKGQKAIVDYLVARSFQEVSDLRSCEHTNPKPFRAHLSFPDLDPAVLRINNYSRGITFYALSMLTII